MALYAAAQRRRTRPGRCVMGPLFYLLWSNKHEMWWRPDSRGYSPNVEDAGRYTVTEAIDRVVQSANHGDRTKVTCMVVAPEHYAPAGEPR